MGLQAVITSAQEATRSVWCAAEACGNEAENGSRLCWRCAKRDSVRLHTPPQQDGPTLRCKVCHAFKPDDEFCRNKNNPHRRGRHEQCRECSRLSRQGRRRKPLTPEQRQRSIEHKRRLRAELAELRRGYA